MKHSRLVLFASLLFTISAHAQTEAERYYQQRSLEGIESFGVVVQIQESQASGLVRRDIETAALSRLKAKGIPAKPYINELHTPLVITLSLAYNARLKVWAGSVRVELMQMGKIDRTGEASAVTTWKRTQVVVTDSTFKELREALASLLDVFAEEFRIANA